MNKQRSNSKGPNQNFQQNFKPNNIPIKSGYSRYNAAKPGPQKLEKKVVLTNNNVLNKPPTVIGSAGATQTGQQPFLG